MARQAQKANSIPCGVLYVPHRALLKGSPPVHGITEKGKKGHQWGKHGARYFGPGSYAKAKKQGAAAHAAGYRSATKKIGKSKGR